MPLPALFTYRIPHGFDKEVKFGVRVIVPFGKNKLYAAIAMRVHTTAPEHFTTKYVLDVIDNQAVITERQIALWEWMAQYYMCHLGEVMSAALPSALKLASETKIMLHPNFDGDLTTLTEREIRLTESLSHHQVMTIDEVAKSLDIAKIIPIIKSLVEKEIVITDEEIKNPYKPKIEHFVSLAEPYATNDSLLYEKIDELSQSKRTEKQMELLLAFLMMKKQSATASAAPFRTKKSDFLQHEAATATRLQALVEKGVLQVEEVKISRLVDYSANAAAEQIQLSDYQTVAMQSIKQEWTTHPVVLLHGITGSGKTEIYIKLIDKVLAEGKQVLYLLPEIALTTQIVNRLRRYFGDKVGVYHSRFGEYERVEIWNRVLMQDGVQFSSKYQLILGARSALLLPFNNLGLVIVDEEHDPSYKQQEPSPRYHARDSAIMLAKIHGAKTLLGTATPSLSSYYNAQRGKYGLVQLMHRFAESQLPEIWVVSMMETLRQKKMHGHFSQFLIDQIAAALEKKEQVILFQNRRGYSLRLFCNSCETMPTCAHCDVTLTYHKTTNLLKCHYCGYAIEVPRLCPACKSADIEMKGFGTEKIEEALSELFPDARIARMDLDTTRSKFAYQRIISDFEEQKTDILVGTQMVTKGLDFDRVSVVGILNADSLISYPDFRSFERAFQVMAQVSGRAGRKEVPGKVVIQAFQPNHPALQFVASNDYAAMYDSQIAERQQFKYPPIYKLIKITLKHKEEEKVNEASAALAPMLHKRFPQQVLGPEFPLVARIQNYFMKDFYLKFPSDTTLPKRKLALQNIVETFCASPKFKSVRVVINVDC